MPNIPGINLADLMNRDSLDAFLQERSLGEAISRTEKWSSDYPRESELMETIKELSHEKKIDHIEADLVEHAQPGGSQLIETDLLLSNIQQEYWYMGDISRANKNGNFLVINRDKEQALYTNDVITLKPETREALLNNVNLLRSQLRVHLGKVRTTVIDNYVDNIRLNNDPMYYIEKVQNFFSTEEPEAQRLHFDEEMLEEYNSAMSGKFVNREEAQQRARSTLMHLTANNPSRLGMPYTGDLLETLDTLANKLGGEIPLEGATITRAVLERTTNIVENETTMNELGVYPGFHDAVSLAAIAKLESTLKE